jgi:hypothetical protein
MNVLIASGNEIEFERRANKKGGNKFGWAKNVVAEKNLSV